MVLRFLRFLRLFVFILRFKENLFVVDVKRDGLNFFFVNFMFVN